METLLPWLQEGTGKPSIASGENVCKLHTSVAFLKVWIMASSKVVTSQLNHNTSLRTPNPCHVVINLMSANDPDQWIPPEGPVVQPPKHVQRFVRRRLAEKPSGAAFAAFENEVSSPYHGRREGLQSYHSNINIRKDFFKIQHTKNLHHIGYEIFDLMRHRRKEHSFALHHGDTTKGWYVLKQIHNPEVFEAMADLIAKIENYEFFAAFEALLAFVHNNRIMIRLSSGGKRETADLGRPDSVLFRGLR